MSAAYKADPLPYDYKALEPHITEDILKFHYDKHHQGYVAKLNGLLKDASETLEQLIKTKDGAVYNNAAQIWNHTFYWNSMSPQGGGEPKGKIAEEINKSYGDFIAFKAEFSAKAAGHFGSGWVWLVKPPGADSKITIVDTHDAGNPLRSGEGTPLLTCDVWEHAYYLQFKNDRASYVQAWWNLVNWDFANQQLERTK